MITIPVYLTQGSPLLGCHAAVAATLEFQPDPTSGIIPNEQASPATSEQL